MAGSSNSSRHGYWLIAALGIALVGASAASARTITLRWQHPDPGAVVGFRAHWGAEPRSTAAYDDQLNLGLPASSGGIFTADVVVPDHTVYVAVTAFDAQGSSAFSNEKIHLGNAPSPGDTPPAEANGAITGFALWDAQNDTLIDGDFRDGDEISLDTHGCVAIQVLVNGYLSQSNSPGSVLFGFDGAVPASCSEAGVSHENSPPYTWERDAGPQAYDCAPSLTEPGTHTLGAMPFDGDNCTGASGQLQTVTFEILAPGGGSGGGTPLGQPGQPILIY